MVDASDTLTFYEFLLERYIFLVPYLITTRAHKDVDHVSILNHLTELLASMKLCRESEISQNDILCWHVCTLHVVYNS